MDCTALAEHLWLIITIQFQIKSMIVFLRSVVKQDKIRHGGSEAVQQGITRIGATLDVTFCPKNCKTVCPLISVFKLLFFCNQFTDVKVQYLVCAVKK